MVLLGSCVAELGTPYEPFDEPIRLLLPTIRQGKIPLEDWAAAGDEPRLELLSAVAGRTETALADGDPGNRRGLYEAVVAPFRAAANQSPLVLVLEDLQWAGETAVELLRYLVERAAESRILILATHRTSAPDRFRSLGAVIAGLHRLDGVRRLDLSPLTADDIAEYLTCQVPDQRHRRTRHCLGAPARGPPPVPTRLGHLAAPQAGYPEAPAGLRGSSQRPASRACARRRVVLSCPASAIATAARSPRCPCP